MPIDALSVLYAQLTCDLLAIAKFLLHVAIVPANAYQRTKFQLSSSISLGDMRESQTKKRELLISPDAP